MAEERATCPICGGRRWVSENGEPPKRCPGCAGRGWVDPEEGRLVEEVEDDPLILEE
jgi:hypothetical protein